jgi:hypothetical protein
MRKKLKRLIHCKYLSSKCETSSGRGVWEKSFLLPYSLPITDDDNDDNDNDYDNNDDTFDNDDNYDDNNDDDFDNDDNYDDYDDDSDFN